MATDAQLLREALAGEIRSLEALVERHFGLAHVVLHTAGTESGPYVMESWDRGNEIVLARNPDYWNADAVQNDRVILKIIPEASTRMAMLKTGEAQLADGITGALVGEVADVGQDLVEQIGPWAEVAALPTLVYGPGDDLYVGALVGVMGEIVPPGELLPAVHGYGLVLRYDPDSGQLRDILLGDDPGTLGVGEGGGLVYPMVLAFFPSQTAAFTGTGSGIVVVLNDQKISVGCQR